MPRMGNNTLQVEGVMKVIFLSLFFLSSSYANDVQTKVIKISYLKNIFGHIHQNASRFSTSLTTLACGHPIKVYEVTQRSGKKESIFGPGFHYVSAGNYFGYIQSDSLVDKRPTCFQDRYPKFFDAFNLSITELYYWGRLYDHFSQAKSTVR